MEVLSAIGFFIGIFVLIVWFQTCGAIIRAANALERIESHMRPNDPHTPWPAPPPPPRK
jgi:hypothetical protein